MIVASVVVTFHPDKGVVERIMALSRSLDEIVVVDNGSDSSVLDAIEAQTGCHLIRNGRNFGISVAQNIGIAWLLQNKNPDWIALFDQDSTISADCVKKVRSVLIGANDAKDLAIVCVHPVSETTGVVPRLPDRALFSAASVVGGQRVTDVYVAMASGSFIKTSAFHECGLMHEGFFIDDVDHEFCLRVRRSGKRVVVVNDAHMLHNIGNTKYVNLLGMCLSTTIHGHFRRYYIVRNCLYMLRLYWRQYPFYLLWDVLVQIKNVIKALVLADGGVRKNMSAVLRGFRDGLFNCITHEWRV